MGELSAAALRARGGVPTGGNHDRVRVPSLRRSPVRARGQVQHAAALVRLPVERDVLASVRVPGERRGAGIPGHRPQRHATVNRVNCSFAASRPQASAQGRLWSSEQPMSASPRSPTV
jgi:hypothetical protein